MNNLRLLIKPRRGVAESTRDAPQRYREQPRADWKPWPPSPRLGRLRAPGRFELAAMATDFFGSMKSGAAGFLAGKRAKNRPGGAGDAFFGW